MSEERAEQIVVISLAVFMASEIGAKLYAQPKGSHLGQTAQKHFTRHIVGGFLTFLLASMVAVVAPEVGAFLAVAVAAHAFFQQGLPAINKPYEKSETAQERREKAEAAKERLPGSTPGPFQGVEPLKETSPINLTGSGGAILA